MNSLGQSASSFDAKKDQKLVEPLKRRITIFLKKGIPIFLFLAFIGIFFYVSFESITLTLQGIAFSQQDRIKQITGNQQTLEKDDLGNFEKQALKEFNKESFVKSLNLIVEGHLNISRAFDRLNDINSNLYKFEDEIKKLNKQDGINFPRNLLFNITLLSSDLGEFIFQTQEFLDEKCLKETNIERKIDV